MKDWKRSPEPPSMMGHPSSNNQSISTDSSLPASPALLSCSSDQAGPSCPRRSRTKADVSLGEMSRRVILQRIHLFDTFGSTPFPIVRTILENCTAKKLLALEGESPHFLEHTEYIWKKLCIKDFKDLTQAAQAGTLQEVDNWRGLYAMRQAAQQEALEAAAARVKEKYASLQADRDAHRVRVVATTSPTKQISKANGKIAPVGNMTIGQKLLRNARKQGHARLQMTQGMRKSAPPPPPSPQPMTSTTAKKPRIESAPGMRVGTATSNDTRSPTASTNTIKTRPFNSIVITKRRIPSGVGQVRQS